MCKTAEFLQKKIVGAIACGCRVLGSQHLVALPRQLDGEDAWRRTCDEMRHLVGPPAAACTHGNRQNSMAC